MSSELASDHSPIKVMIVEDHLVYRIGMKVIIETHSDLEVVAEAGDGQRAILLAQELQPDVIVMDVSMPILDGIEATKQIKVLLPDSKVLMLTSHEGDHELFSALSAGADGYCLKDTPAESICSAIKAVKSGVGWLDAAIAKRVMMACTAPAPAPLASPPRENGIKDHAKFALSVRQMEILELVVKGMTNLQMAEHLCVSPDTIKTHMRNIMDKLAVADRTQVAVKAIRDGLVKLEN